MTDSPQYTDVSRSRSLGALAIVVAVAAIAVGVTMGPESGIVAPDPTWLAACGLLAGAVLAAGLVAIARTPGAPPTLPFLGLTAAVAVLTALQSLHGPVSTETSVGQFLVSGPWRYLLTPVAIHFVLEVAWHHQQRHWRGIITGWYALHLALFIATFGGLAFDEVPLVRVVDGFFLRQTFEPIGATLIAGALLLSLASPNRRPSQRVAVSWTLVGALLGFVPAIAVSLFPALPATIGLPIDAPFATIPLFAFLGLTGVLALPMVNPEKRDLTAFPLAQRLLDQADLQAGLRELAEQLQTTFEAAAVVVRVATPPTEVTVGTPGRERAEGPFVPDPETFDQRRAVVAPLGRRGDPLGEVYLEGRFPGAFGRREQDWLMAFLAPISSAIRVRRREAEREVQLAFYATQAAEITRLLARATGLLPELADDDGRGVPLAVDASEVLEQLSTGTRTIGDESKAVEGAVGALRTRSRTASDAVARSIDGMQALDAEIMDLVRRAESIGAVNENLDGVAFRTNLLANTAALEASRAGAAGRTFAVLADEIRRLADATTETSTAIRTEAEAMTVAGGAVREQIDALRAALADAIREAEATEESARRIGEIAGTLESSARALWPAIEEANTVAARRTARDAHLTTNLESLIEERAALGTALTNHRDAMERLGERLERLARVGRSTRPRAKSR